MKDYRAFVKEEHPLKQGLKLSISPIYCCCASCVKEEHPLKQGLKHEFYWINFLEVDVKEEHPLKQGLKRP